ncbi:hypothetical protein CANCADRAFT_148096 [Tortispora caseinolytica NRRL Y-17796]|uniref:Protein CASP n=1 Tax=Tortispora caseinolytica NRRL Y-17796 TaxID=767744 RepID=A0A1E4TGJ6_9ASCO|nr:hypothetical protein CANCADRAFT_148096 [Tortispora caseinolytica NRRL Y-17796]
MDTTKPDDVTIQLENALSSWISVNITELQSNLDKKSEEIINNQKQSLVSRKELATRTKEFRKLDDNEKLTEWKGLLKLYQAEIDNLTNRSKFSDSSFLEVYQKLAEVPDPHPFIELAIEFRQASTKANALQIENETLKAKLSSQKDYDKLKDLLAQTEKRLKEEPEAKVAAKEQELRGLFEEQQRSWTLKEEELNRQVEQYRNQIKELQEKIVSNQSDNAEIAYGAGTSSQYELELLTSDLERTNARALEVESRNLELRQELEAIKSESKLLDADFLRDQVVNLTADVDRLESQNMAYHRQVESLTTELDNLRGQSEKRVVSLERELSRRIQELDSLKAKVEQARDYDEIKRELTTLRSVMFGSEEWEDSAGGDNSEQGQLETMAVIHSQKLTSEVTVLRNEKNDLLKELSNAQSKVSELSKALDEVNALNRKLELDLSTVSHTTPSRYAESVRGGSVAPSIANHGLSRSGRISPTTSILGGMIPEEMDGDTSVSSSGANNVLPIITHQRDRFKQRNQELEDELRSQIAKMAELKNEIQKLKRENSSLSNKAKYVKTFQSGPSLEAGTGGRGGYNVRISPFERSGRALGHMNQLERGLYKAADLIFANKLTRSLFAGYCIFVHLFIMYMFFMGLGSSSPKVS